MFAAGFSYIGAAHADKKISVFRLRKVSLILKYSNKFSCNFSFIDMLPYTYMLTAAILNSVPICSYGNSRIWPYGNAVPI